MKNARMAAALTPPLAALMMLLLAAWPGQVAWARSADSADLKQRYIIELRDPPLALSNVGRSEAESRLQQQAAAAGKPGASRAFGLNTAAAREYLGKLERRQDEFGLEAAVLLGRQLQAAHRYRLATNGLAADLTPAEARLLAESPTVKSITLDHRFSLATDAGPPWIGANEVWSGATGFPAARGENIVVGVIDSGINWEHPSFGDPSTDGYVFNNPLGIRLGLCDDPEVGCNNKLIGVYDFIEDDPDTEENENTKGRDDDVVGHGSHVASIAVGNRLNVLINGSTSLNFSGVAPRANLVTYRVCAQAEPETGGCIGSAILAAIDQAIEDGVDVINYSIGSEARDPWASGGISNAFLAARNAGIFVVTSAGNAGPDSGTIGSPANAPWIVAVGDATHNRIFALGFDLTGGPAGLACLEGTGPEVEATLGPLPVVFAGEVGDPLGCTPFPDGSMTGAIALIERGSCLFATKVANAEAAGADFMVVFNNVAGAPIIMGGVDDSNISSCMLSNNQGAEARDFVLGAPGATGRINFPFTRLVNDAFGDEVAASSSRGPTAEPLEDTLKPNLIAPGRAILAASNEGQEFRSNSGTSMASPHIAGAAALLKSVHGDWSPSQLVSAIETTATPELANVRGSIQATPQDRGTGRPQLGEAVNAGLFLEVTGPQFSAANPNRGGDPKSLNLAGLVDSGCRDVCSFSRRVTDQMGGGDWTATPVDFPAEVAITIVPDNFTLGNGASQELTISVDLRGLGLVGGWVSGRVRLSAAGSPDQFLTVSVGGGDLVIEDDRNSGWQDIWLPGLAALPGATYRSGGLQPAHRRVEALVQDPTRDDPYDGGEGVFTQWHELPEGGLWLFAETLASTATDLDLFVGRDSNGNGAADAAEELCNSITPTDLERCDLFDLAAGNYWIVVQNWDGTIASGDEATLVSAAIGPGVHDTLTATGPGIVEKGESYNLRLSWDNLAALPGDQWFGALGIGSDRDRPNDISVVPIRFTRIGIGQPETLPLFDGVDHELALAAGGVHDRMFIDVPAGTESLVVSARRIDGEANDGLGLELRRLDFTSALADPPFAVPPGGSQVIESASGSGDAGPSATVSSPQAGRWYAVMANGTASPAPIEVRASLAFEGSPAPVHRGLWESNSRPGLRQGFDYNWGSIDRSLIWYTYDEAGQPAWYIAGSPSPAGNAWFSPLYRVTNDGAQQQLTAVGRVAVTILAEDDALFTFTLFGESGTDRMQPLSVPTCPQINGGTRSYTGIWYRGADGLGGASVVVNAQTQAQIHYLFDDVGAPRWLVAQEPDGQGSPTAGEMPMLQFRGYCAVCEGEPPTSETMGVLSRSFSSETAGSWTLDYLFQAPLSGSVERTDPIVKLTATLDCL